MKKNNVEKMISPGLKIETELKYEEILQDKLDSIEDLFNLNTRRLDEVSFKRNELNKQEEEIQFELSGLNGARTVLQELIEEAKIQ
tara:strand:- start:42 stop:299 length:258 start_codon:yes stop_codon:yes gene_type:complete